MQFKLFAQIGYTILIALETLLSLRLVLKFINVSSSTGLISWLYSFTNTILRPFSGIVTDTVNIWGLTLELSTLLVIFILTLCSYAVYELIKAYSE